MGYFLKGVFFKPYKRREEDHPTPRPQRSQNNNSFLSPTSVALNASTSQLPTSSLYHAYAPRPVFTEWFTSPKLVFNGIEREEVRGAMIEIYRSKLRFVYANKNAGVVIADLFRFGSGSSAGCGNRRLVYAAEIIDNRNHFFDSSSAKWEKERLNWSMFKPFDHLPSIVRRSADHNVDLSRDRFIYMRLRPLKHVLSASEIASDKAAAFAIRTAPNTGIVYYICLDSQDGHIIGVYPRETRSGRTISLHPDGPPPRPRELQSIIEAKRSVNSMPGSSPRDNYSESVLMSIPRRGSRTSSDGGIVRRASVHAESGNLNDINRNRLSTDLMRTNSLHHNTSESSSQTSSAENLQAGSHNLGRGTSARSSHASSSTNMELSSESLFEMTSASHFGDPPVAEVDSPDTSSGDLMSTSLLTFKRDSDCA